MAGLNLNPKKEEIECQFNEIELLLERICKKTFLMPTGWEIIRQIYYVEEDQPKNSTCKFEKVLLNENFRFTRPLTITGAYLLPDRLIDGVFFPEEVFFHQMVLDHVDVSTNEYVIHNTSFAEGGPVLRISKKNEYYSCDQNARMNTAGQSKLSGQNGEKWSLVHEIAGNMKPKTWYLLPQAYSITLTPEQNEEQQELVDQFLAVGFENGTTPEPELDSTDIQDAAQEPIMRPRKKIRSRACNLM